MCAQNFNLAPKLFQNRVFQRQLLHFCMKGGGSSGRLVYHKSVHHKKTVIYSFDRFQYIVL